MCSAVWVRVYSVVVHRCHVVAGGIASWVVGPGRVALMNAGHATASLSLPAGELRFLHIALNKQWHRDNVAEPGRCFTADNLVQFLI